MKPASEPQRQYVAGLLRGAQGVPDELRRLATSPRLTHEDCTEVIPALKALQPKADTREDWTSPEGYDYSPDMGVHRHDGGGSW